MTFFTLPSPRTARRWPRRNIARRRRASSACGTWPRGTSACWPSNYPATPTTSFSLQMVISPDGKWIAQGTPEETLLWDVGARKLRHRFARAGPHVAFAPDSRSLFTAGALVLRWDVDSGKLLYQDTRGDGHVGPVVSLAFAPDGRSLATCGYDGTVRVWDLAKQTHQLLRGDAPERGARVLVWPDGRWAG